ncbi:HSP70-domain-containing protein [Thozetella sp. PMI_491]|nr:HSP70-domain-containing protein [Thozetella sp. PMI_491]
MRNSQVEILPSNLTSQFSPSYIAFTDNGTLFGEAARLHAIVDPANTISDIRHLLGRKFSTIQPDIQCLPFHITSEGDRPLVQVDVAGNQTQYTLEELESMILAKIKEVVEAYWGYEKTNTVMTIPNYFTDHQREAIRSAAETAGISIVRFLPESNAASIAHGLDIASQYDEKFYLLGNLEDKLTLHVMGVDQGVFEVLASTYDIDFHSPTSDIHTHYQDANCPDQCVCTSSSELNKSTLATMTTFQTNLESVDKILRSANITKGEVDGLVLVGRSPHLTELKEALEEHFNLAAQNVTSPEDAFIIGATIQSGVLSSHEWDCWCGVMNMIGISIGIETSGGIMTKLIARNTPIPITKKKIFTTAADNQSSVLISLYEGERLHTANNFFLGQFELGIPPAPRGTPQIEVSFEMDQYFGLEVKARERNSGMEDCLRVHLNNDERYGHQRLEYEVYQAQRYSWGEEALRELLAPEMTLNGRMQ